MAALPGRGGFAATLRSVDLYRRIPKDLTESTLLGAVLSLISAAVIGALFFLNLRSMFEGEHSLARLRPTALPSTECIDVKRCLGSDAHAANDVRLPVLGNLLLGTAHQSEPKAGCELAE